MVLVYTLVDCIGFIRRHSSPAISCHRSRSIVCVSLNEGHQRVWVVPQEVKS